MTPNGAKTQPDAWTAFGVGVLGGFVGGLSLLSFAGILAVALVAIVGGLELRPRPFGAAGALLGWGATWIVVLSAAQARCDTPCSTDITPWIVFALGLAGIGSGLVLVGITQPAWAIGVARAAGTLLSWRPVRVGIAILLGALAGCYGASLLLFGWATTVPLWLWFAWRHRSPERRAEIVWLTVAAIVTFAALAPR